MEFKTLTFKFPRPLNAEQDERFISAIQCITRDAQQRLLKGAKTLKLPIISQSDISKLTATQMQHAGENFNQFVKLNRIDGKTYVFKIASQNFQFIRLPIPILNKTKQYWAILFEKTKKLIENDVAKDLGFRQREIKYEKGVEEEKEEGIKYEKGVEEEKEEPSKITRR